MKNLIYNAVKCNICDETIVSYYTHDYKHCTCGNAMVDGGLSYGRYGWAEGLDSITKIDIYMEDVPFSVARHYFHRYNRKTDKHIKLKDIDDEWLDAIVKYYLPPNNIGTMYYQYLLLYIQEKLYRAEQEY